MLQLTSTPAFDAIAVEVFGPLSRRRVLVIAQRRADSAAGVLAESVRRTDHDASTCPRCCWQHGRRVNAMRDAAALVRRDRRARRYRGNVRSAWYEA